MSNHSSYGKAVPFHALGIGANGDKETAVKTLAVAIPKLFELGRGQGSTESGVLTSARTGWILEGYIALLADLHRAKVRSGIEPYVEAFRIADLARASRVEKALSAAIVRGSINDPQLAAVLRRAQDLDYQVKAISETLTALQQGVKTDKPDPNREKAIEKTRAELARVREENDQAQAELKRKLPDYSELLNAKPLTIGDAQKLLKPQEALISLYSTQQQTLVWAMAGQGQPAFQVVDLPSAKVAELVTNLRKALDPTEADISQVPTFDFATALELYQKLLAPVEAGWKNAKELIIVPHGALSELPFSVLVTSAYQPNKSGIPFSDHGGAPWLIKNAAISYLPSLSALASLRRGVAPSAANSFIGFGDPVFGGGAKSAAPVAARGMVRRNAKAAAAPSSPTSNLELLQALPDTADEVRDIAKILRADEGRDVHLGRRASEQSVKNADLSALPGCHVRDSRLGTGRVAGIEPTGVGSEQSGYYGRKRRRPAHTSGNTRPQAARRLGCLIGLQHRIRRRPGIRSGLRPGPRLFLRRRQSLAGIPLAGGNGVGETAYDGIVQTTI